MASSNGTDRVTNKQLYDELTNLRRDLPSRSEVRVTVALAVLGGNAVAAAVLKFTGTGTAVQEAAEFALRWL